MIRRIGVPFGGALLGVAAVAAATALCRALDANASTAGFLLLLVVLGVALRGGLSTSVVASAAAAIAYNYFFLPPLYELTIAEPANWMAFAAFLVTSIVTSRLVRDARRRAEEADARRRETETLYELCFGLFASTNRRGSHAEAAARTLSAVGSSGGALVLLHDGDREATYLEGEAAAIADDPAVVAAIERGETVDLARGSGTALPLDIGGWISGALVLRGTTASPRVLASAARLLGLSVERHRLLADAALGEALAASDQMRTGLLRAVSHDLRTPLTALAIDLEAILREAPPETKLGARARSAARERERLGRRIDNLLAAARLEAGLFRPHPEPIPPGELFRTTRDNLSRVLEETDVRVAIAPDCPDVRVDAALAVEVLVNLVENAARVTPAGRALELRASPFDSRRVALEIADRGPGLPPGVRGELSGKAPVVDASDRRGLGLSIARELAAACGGSLRFEDRAGGGTTAIFEVPAAAVQVTREVER